MFMAFYTTFPCEIAWENMKLLRGIQFQRHYSGKIAIKSSQSYTSQIIRDYVR